MRLPGGQKGKQRAIQSQAERADDTRKKIRELVTNEYGEHDSVGLQHFVDRVQELGF